MSEKKIRSGVLSLSQIRMCRHRIKYMERSSLIQGLVSRKFIYSGKISNRFTRSLKYKKQRRFNSRLLQSRTRGQHLTWRRKARRHHRQKLNLRLRPQAFASKSFESKKTLIEDKAPSGIFKILSLLQYLCRLQFQRIVLVLFLLLNLFSFSLIQKLKIREKEKTLTRSFVSIISERKGQCEKEIKDLTKIKDLEVLSERKTEDRRPKIRQSNFSVQDSKLRFWSILQMYCIICTILIICVHPYQSKSFGGLAVNLKQAGIFSGFESANLGMSIISWGIFETTILFSLYIGFTRNISI